MSEIEVFHIKTKVKGNEDKLIPTEYPRDLLYLNTTPPFLAAFTDLSNNKGRIDCYTSPEAYRKAQEIINQRGITPTNLEQKVADKIATNTGQQDVELKRKYDGSTKMLAEILAGKYRKKQVRKWLKNVLLPT